MKLWEKNIKTADAVMNFTVGNDPLYDKLLAPYDIIGSMAHALMLSEAGIISREDSQKLVGALADYFHVVNKADFSLKKEDEDIHSHLESYLVSTVGDAGKRIHTARSRNDQVMVALQLFMKEEWRVLLSEVKDLFDVFIAAGDKHQNILIPGYTHTQVAMPSSIALWLGSYAESLVNDVKISSGIIDFIDQSALGSAAGYGSSFPIDRERTSMLAGFGDLLVSSASAQLNRGKMEGSMAYGLSSFAETLSRLAADMILYMGQDMDFIHFPDELTTGSSIMPHKKNPDVLELVRAHCNTVRALPATMSGLTANMISGYHRDFQLTKEILFPGIQKLKQCIQMMQVMVTNMEPRDNTLRKDKYLTIFSVEEVNKKVMQGLTFRDAYKEVASEIASGDYKPSGKQSYTHTGSIGNPSLGLINEKMEKSLAGINITAAKDIFEALAGYEFD